MLAKKIPVIGLALVVAVPTSALRATSGPVCASFAPTDLPHGATITKAEARTADGVFPDACIVRGTIPTSPTSTITWAVELPAHDVWNGKTLTFGGSGFDGFTPTDADYYHVMAGPASVGYARMGSDSGHQVRSFFPWAVDEVALRNHAFEANHLTLEVGTAVTTQFYGKRPTRRYMLGQSNGGRSALVAVQRYPKDYDGVIALEPAIFQQAHEVNLGSTTMKHIYSKPENWLNEAEIALFAEAERTACDKLDGLEDGIIANIDACPYLPTDLLCKEADTDACLTAGQIESIRLVYADQHEGVAMADGSRGYPRFGRGGAATSDWVGYLFGSSFEARDAFNYYAAAEAAKVVENDEHVDRFRHDPAEFADAYLELSRLMDPSDPDLSPFSDHGGKLLVWYGTADTCVSIYRTAQYFDRIRDRMGAEKVSTFARFLVTPGIGHEGNGPGPETHDLLTALDEWVENGVAPDALIARKVDRESGKTILERPMCEYPKFARYKGTGDVTKADSFYCADR